MFIHLSPDTLSHLNPETVKHGLQSAKEIMDQFYSLCMASQRFLLFLAPIIASIGRYIHKRLRKARREQEEWQTVFIPWYRARKNCPPKKLEPVPVKQRRRR